MKQLGARAIAIVVWVWTLAWGLGGTVVGSMVGYGNGGWIGAICLAFAGAIIGLFVSRLGT